MADDDFKDDTVLGSRKKGKKSCPLSVAKKIQIVHQVLIDNEFQKDVAKEHRIGIMTVNQLVNKAKKKPSFIQEIIDKRDLKREHFDKIADVAEQLAVGNEVIDSADQIC